MKGMDMRQRTALFLVLAMLCGVALCACADRSASEDAEPEETATPEATITPEPTPAPTPETTEEPTPEPTPEPLRVMITMDLEDVKVGMGRTLQLHAEAENAVDIRWEFINWDGSDVIDAQNDRAQYFVQNNSMSGYNSNTLTIKVVSGNIDGWRVRAVFIGEDGSTVETTAAYVACGRNLAGDVLWDGETVIYDGSGGEVDPDSVKPQDVPATPAPAAPTSSGTVTPTPAPASAATPTPKPAATPTPKPPQGSTPTATPKPAGCSHNWKAETKTVHHDAVTEQVWVVDKAAWDEAISGGYVCNACGYKESRLSDSFDDHLYTHNPPSGYHAEDSKTVHHNEEGHYETRIIAGAYDETITTGYVCVICGEHRSA